MYTAKVQNMMGNILELTHNEANWQIVSITGLNPPNATINTSTMALWDGARFNSARLQTRNIVITLKLNDKVEENRQLLYSYFQSKNWCRFFFQNESRDVYIDGYVETIECDLFSNSESMQISMICPSPYFKSVEKTVNELDSVVSMFHFPFPTTDNDLMVFGHYDNSPQVTVENGGYLSCGCIITLIARNNVSNPMLFNYDTGEFFGITFDMLSGDEITINTNKGEKTITLLRDGVQTNIFNSIVKNSTWLQLISGQTTFTYEVSGGNLNDLYVTITHDDLFEGV